VGFKITPLQTLAYYNAVANGGRLLEPLFVGKIESHKKVIQEFKPKVLNSQIASPEVIAKAQKYLEAVVYGTHGSARKFQKPEFTFAGKTGTRDYWDEQKIRANGRRGDYDYTYNDVSFCGYFPKDNPKYSCIIYISRVPVKSSLAAEVFAAIAQKITENDKMLANPKTDTSNGTKYSSVEIASVRDLGVIFRTLGYPISFDHRADNYVKAVAANDHPYISVIPFNFYTKPGEIPRVIGMNARDAVYVLAQKGYKTLVKGKGYVYKQYPKGQTIVLELRTSFDASFPSNPLAENP
jgi:cell division protein FtsI (penicillin-binding protein 3)